MRLRSMLFVPGDSERKFVKATGTGAKDLAAAIGATDNKEPVNRAYLPSDAEVAHARRLVDAFAAQPDAGTLGIDGRMYDIPHFKAARATLAAVAA